MSNGLANGSDHSQTTSGKGISEVISVADIVWFPSIQQVKGSMGSFHRFGPYQ